MNRLKHTLGPLVVYHGCDAKVGEAVLSGQFKLSPSTNEYDWLGPGIYFWVDSPERARNWADELGKRPNSKIEQPFVLGALIHPGLCLNLTDYGVMQELVDAHAFLLAALEQAGSPVPVNAGYRNGLSLRRSLDCAVIKTLHQRRKQQGLDPYDTVYGVFEEGGEIYPGAAFKRHTHVQVSVLNPACIIGYFRVAADQ